MYWHVADNLRVVVLISLDTAIDMQLHRSGHAVGALFENDLHLVGTMIVIEQFDLMTDQSDRCFEQLTVEGKRTVFGDLSANPLSEVTGKVVRSRSQALHVVGKPGKWRLAGGAVFTLVVDTV